MRARLQSVVVLAALCLAAFAGPVAARDAAPRARTAPSPAELKRLGRLLKDMAAPDPKTAYAAWKRLREMGNLATPGLLHFLADGERAERRQAAEALGDIKDAVAVSGLIQALSDPEPEVREFAARSLGAIAEGRAAVPLRRALADSDSEVRAKAAWALVELGERSVLEAYYARQRNSPSAYRRGRAAQAYGRAGRGPDAKKLAALLEDESRDVRRHFIDALGALASVEAVDLLIEALDDDFRKNRAAALRWLHKLTRERAIGFDRAKWDLWWEVNRQGYQLKKTGSAKARLGPARDKAPDKKSATEKELEELIRHSFPDERNKPRPKEQEPPEPEGEVPII